MDWQPSSGTKPQVGRKRWGLSNPQTSSQFLFAYEHRYSHHSYGLSEALIPLCILLDHLSLLLMLKLLLLKTQMYSKVERTLWWAFKYSPPNHNNSLGPTLLPGRAWSPDRVSAAPGNLLERQILSFFLIFYLYWGIADNGLPGLESGFVWP